MTARAGGRTTLATFAERKALGVPIVMTTAYDYSTARIIDTAGFDAILVGDSLGMVVLGYADTRSVTVDDMLRHTRAVTRGAAATMVVADLPFRSYTSPAQAVRTAATLVRNGLADAVKLEGGASVARSVRAVVRAGFAVQGHIGLTPQEGEWRVQGRTASTARRILEDALALQDAGCFAIVIECVPTRVAGYITQALEIPTIGIGAGNRTSGQVLVLHDLLGLTPTAPPRFSKVFADAASVTRRGLRAFQREVRRGRFPAARHTYSMADEEWRRFLAEIGATRRR